MRWAAAAVFLLVSFAIPEATSQAGACATLNWQDEALPNGRLMPETGQFRSNVSYVLAATGASCQPRPCTTPSQQIEFRVKSAPAYAVATFEPSTASLSQQGGQFVARSRLTVTTNSSAPALKDDAYRVEVRGCPHPEVEADKIIKNDYRPGLNGTIGNASESPTSDVPGVGWGVAAASLGGVVAVLAGRRRGLGGP